MLDEQEINPRVILEMDPQTLRKISDYRQDKSIRKQTPEIVRKKIRAAFHFFSWIPWKTIYRLIIAGPIQPLPL